MIEQELRELDVWIAEHVFGWRIVDLVKINGVEYTGPIWWSPTYGDPFDPKSGAMAHSIPLTYSSSVVCFSLIKREIERRGWGWISAASFDNPPRYAFHITDKRQRGLALREAETEELAGCLAFKTAMEAMD